MIIIGIPRAALRICLHGDVAHGVVAVADGRAVGVCDGGFVAKEIDFLLITIESLDGIANEKLKKQERLQNAGK